MTHPASEKTVLLQGLDPALGRALREQLAGLPGMQVSDDPASDADLLVTPAADSVAAPAVPRLVLGRGPWRLGDVMAAVRRALDEPALAVEPFRLGDGLFCPAEKKIERDDGDVGLTERETMLLLYLARRHPQAVSRDTVLRDVWRYQDGIDTHTLETHIYRLRQKIEKDSTAPQLLVTTDDGYLLAGIAAAGPLRKGDDA